MEHHGAASQEWVQESDGESGQASVLLLVMLGTFLLVSLAFAVDLTNLWYLRQALQTAADAACQAGAADMVVLASGATLSSAGFTVGVAGNCSSSPSATMCSYAKFNGYHGTGLDAGAASNSVAWSFPTTVTGVTAPSSTITAYPFLRVIVTENVKTWFMGLVGINYQQDAAACTCGLSLVQSTPPIVILHPTRSGSLSQSGSGSVTIYGGPQRSLQINSNSSGAVSLGGSASLDLRAAGPSGTGGDLGVTWGPTTSSSAYNGGTTGRWRSGTLPTVDPFGTVPAPAVPVTAPVPASVKYHVDGCPDPSGCSEYSPGSYSGISVKNGTAIFLPGVYYLTGDLTADANSTLRNAYTSTPPTTGGVMFYLASGGVNISANSGNSSTLDTVPASYLTCNSSQSLPAGVSSALSGNVLWAQCTSRGTYVGNPSTDTLSSAGARGLLIFAAHSNVPSLNFNGGGGLGFVGALYFHNSTYQDVFNLGGGSGGNTFVSGLIVTDQMSLGGNGSITMSLSAIPTIGMVKVGVYQ
jgi:hypothetical protein